MNRGNLLHGLLIPSAGVLIFITALAMRGGSTDFLLFLLALSLLNVGLPAAWMYKHRRQISTLGDVPHVLRRQLTRSTVYVLLLAITLAPLSGVVGRAVGLSDSASSRVALVVLVGVLYCIFLWPKKRNEHRHLI